MTKEFKSGNNGKKYYTKRMDLIQQTIVEVQNDRYFRKFNPTGIHALIDNMIQRKTQQYGKAYDTIYRQYYLDMSDNSLERFLKDVLKELELEAKIRRHMDYGQSMK